MGGVQQQRYLGLRGASRGWFLARLQRTHQNLVIVVSQEQDAEQLAMDTRFFCGAVPVVHYPPQDSLPFEHVSVSPDVSARQLALLDLMHQRSSPWIIITSVEPLLDRLLTPAELFTRGINILQGARGELATLFKELLERGFRPASLVQDIGEVALRGQVLDFFCAAVPEPIRVEIVDGIVRSIKTFDPDSQRTNTALSSVRITPITSHLKTLNAPELTELIEALKARGKELDIPPTELARLAELVRSQKPFPGHEVLRALRKPLEAHLLEHIPNDVPLVFCDSHRARARLESYEEHILSRAKHLTTEGLLFPPPEQLYHTAEKILSNRGLQAAIALDALEILSHDTAPTPAVRLESFGHTELSTQLKASLGTGEAYAPLKKAVTRLRKANHRVAFVVGAQGRAERLQRVLLSIDIDAPIRSDLSPLQWLGQSSAPPVVILQGMISQGFDLPAEQITFIAESEVFPERSYRSGKKRTLSLKKIMSSLSQLQEGDFVVHADFGIGRYHGLKHLDVEGAEGDFLHLQYADSVLYLPVQNIGKVHKFSGVEGQVPTIDKLSSTRWARTRAKVRESVVALAGELIKLYAERSVAQGWRFDPAGAADERFSEDFPYDETTDQTAAIRDTLKDMALDRPMDRLVCGDVGFGKTEVAIRAAYKCAQHARQTAVLVPTTILAEQHRTSFVSRFSGYPVKVGAVSRFYTAEQNQATLAALAEGQLDIIIGTHKLLQKDVQFKDLGLVIIDEEHRFGVKQKERLKQLRKQIDVLTLTATPIPRTLHMALLGIRDISVIATPPHDRKVIRTFVATADDSLIRDAIIRELQRGGQCFYLHNRIETITSVVQHLKELLPEARVEFAHGQMAEGALEKIMHRFMAREFDILVSTTIIESGIDLPNANTILISRADTFGLAQLYQIRGRVGRSDRQAYCYFLVPQLGKLGPEAAERLRALQSLDDLGLGFNLAVRDLEIRGAGNLLGKEQSGSVLAVGFDLYMRILKEAVLNLRGEQPELTEIIDPEVKLGIDAYIPESYIPDVQERLILYQRLAAVLTRAEAQALAEEIEDRFGPPGPETRSLVELMAYRALLKRYGVVSAELREGNLRLSFSPRAPLDAAKLLALEAHHPKNYRMGKNYTFMILGAASTGAKPDDLFQETERILKLVARDQAHTNTIQTTPPSMTATPKSL